MAARACAGSSSCTSTRRATSSGSARPPARCAALAVADAARARRFTGRADHAGTTRRDERRDALAAAARIVVAADELAGGDPDFLVTAARMLVEPNAFTTVPSGVRLWIDAPHARPGAARRVARRADRARRRAGGGDRVGIDVATASHTDGVEFAPSRDALGDLPAARLLRRATTRASSLRAMPAGMVFVRNPTGVSHAPEEDVSLDDAAVAATALLRALERLA